jgi:isopentenyl diphosphate isomerase/L-lactate dehydrogenase-like FMN-dependent dehydrogenase
MSRPLKLTWDTKIEALQHPGWMMEYYTNGGQPMFPNWAPYAGAGASAEQVAEFMTTQTTPPLDWKDVENFRKIWPRNLVLKGVMHPADAQRAAAMGVDGIMVSNHGGRQLDGTVAPLRALAAVASEAGDMTIMMDSGIRRGTDVLKALALGAKFVFIGRPFLYAASVAGEAGVHHAARLLREEISRDMAMLGISSLAEMTRELLVPSRGPI